MRRAMDEVNMSCESLHFKKQGGEIREAIKLRSSKLAVEAEGLQKAIGVLCKARDLDMVEVLAAGDDEQAVGTYSNKAFNNAPKTNLVLKALQEDLNTIRRQVRELQVVKGTNEALQLVADNIEVGRDFDLTFDELRTLGF